MPHYTTQDAEVISYMEDKFSTLKEKFHTSTWPCNVLLIT